MIIIQHITPLKEAWECESENCWLLYGSGAACCTSWRPDFSSNTLLLSELNMYTMTGPESLQLPGVPCCPKMAETVRYWAAAAGSNYWLGCGKWGQMHCIIREPVDSGSPSQWLVINKIIGERWQRFLEFFLICMSFCTEFFMTSFSIGEGWVANDTVSYGVTCLCFWSQTDSVRPKQEAKQRLWRAPVRSQDPIFVLWRNPESFSIHKSYLHRCSPHSYAAGESATSLFKHYFIL